jgi:hypothetical protein
MVKATPCSLYPRDRRSGIHCTGGWMDNREGLGACGKKLPAPRPDPRTVQPVANRDAD